MEIRIAQRDDWDAILRLSQESDSTARSIETWEGNSLQAVLAFDGGQLIGMLPLEERVWEIGHGDRLNVLWATGVHVDAAYRGRGIGGQLDTFATKTFADRFDAFCVFREDETSPAFNWYRKNGYHRQAHIRAYRLPVVTADSHSDAARFSCRHLTTRQELLDAGPDLLSCFNALRNDWGGYAARTPESWVKAWDYHYYRASYSYSVMALVEEDRTTAFALLGETSMRDGVTRYDILEFAADAGEAENNLHAAVLSAARLKGLEEIRMQIISGDPREDWLNRLGYLYRDRSTNILGKVLAPGRILARLADRQKAAWNWQTEGWGDIKSPGAAGTMAANDAALTAFCFHRLSVEHAAQAGDVQWLGPGAPPAIPGLPAPWRYFQADYI